MTTASDTKTPAKYVPTFFVMNKQGMFLAQHPKPTRNTLAVIWVRSRDDAASFDNWSEAAALGSKLPVAVQGSAAIVDQYGEFWSGDRATKAKVFALKSPAGSKKPSSDKPVAVAA